MSAIERFMVMFEPEDNKIAFRVMLDEMVKEIKKKAETDSEPLIMRDYFAAKALDFSLRDVGLVGVADIEEIEIAVNLAYKIADAMIKERKQ